MSVKLTVKLSPLDWDNAHEASTVEFDTVSAARKEFYTMQKMGGIQWAFITSHGEKIEHYNGFMWRYL